jgi:predicted amidohydrolase
MPNPIDRKSMRANTDRMLSMIDSAVAGAAPFLPVRLVIFPEFAHAAPIFETAAELLEKLRSKSQMNTLSVWRRRHANSISISSQAQ